MQDLSAIRAASALEGEKDAGEAQLAAAERVNQWDKAMQRAFKGIMPRATRHFYLRRAAARVEAGE